MNEPGTQGLFLKSAFALSLAGRIPAAPKDALDTNIQRHSFLCAGERDTRKAVSSMFIVKQGKAWKPSSWKNPDLGSSTSIQLLDGPGVPIDRDIQR